MGGPVGAMSIKLVLKAGMLLFAARLDGHSATATIDPAAPETVITPQLAERLKLAASGEGDQEVRRGHVIGLDHAELRLRRVLVRKVEGAATIVIGQDLLAQMRIRLDFARGQLRVLDASDRARTGDGDAIISLKREASGCLALQVPDEPKPVGFAAPVANVVDEVPVAPIAVGGLQVPTFDGRSFKGCGPDTKVVTWTSFRAMRVMIDLPHERLILGKAGS